MSDLPVLPPLDPEQIATWFETHGRFFEQDAAASPPARAAARRLLRRQLVEGLANVQPVLADIDHPLLFPPPRRFLTRILEQRLAGAEAAFRHLDVAATMSRMEAGPPVISSSMPHVLNALLSGPVTERETNPGLLRMSSTRWMPDANAFEHPDPSSVPDLVDGAIDIAVRAPVPAIARAGWLAFVMMTVHPFVDGNGRTARALFVALGSADTPAGLDWGVLEQWGLARDAYVRALQAGQKAERYGGADVDPGPFMEFAAETSIRGAQVSAARVGLLGEVADNFNGDPSGVELLLRVMIDRFVRLDMVLDEADDPNQAMALIEALVAEDHLRFGQPPIGQLWSTGTGRGLVLGARSAAIADQLRHARYADV